MVLNSKCDIWKYFDNIVEEGVVVCKLCKRRLKNDRTHSLTKHIRNLHSPKTDVWNYYVNIVDDGVGECKICGKRVRSNRNFNLILHLKKHNIKVLGDTDTPSTSSTIAASASASDAEEQKESEEHLAIIMKEKILTNAVMGLMVDEGVAPFIFASKNMQALLNPVCEAISEQNHKNYSINDLQTERAIQSVASFIRVDFASDFHWRLLSLKIDTASVGSHSNIFRISVQFAKEVQLESRVLSEITVEYAEQLSSESIVNVLLDFYIDIEQIVSVYWDNSKAKCSQSITNSEYLQHIEEFDENPDICIGDIKLERYIGVIAQLCVMDVLKNPFIFKYFLQCRNLTKFINEHPDIYNEAFKQNNLNVPQLDLPWIWGSTYKMMKDLKNAFFILDNLKYEPSESPADGFDFNDTLKKFIEAFYQAFRFLQKCLLKFYDTDMIYGDFFAQWLKCKLLTSKLYVACTKENTILTLMTSELLKSIDTRSEELLNRDHFKACLYLDPRFQHTLSQTEKTSAIEYLKQLWHRAKSYNKRLDESLPEPLPQDNASRPVIIDEDNDDDDDDDDDDILNEYLSKNFEKTNSTGICKKLEDLKLSFQTVETNVLLYWEELKSTDREIYTLAEICFAIPATQSCNTIRPLNQSALNYGKNISPTLQEDVNFIRLNQQILPIAMEKLNLFGEDNSLEIFQAQELSEDSLTTTVINAADHIDNNDMTSSF